jgi:hypothetical protein
MCQNCGQIDRLKRLHHEPLCWYGLTSFKANLGGFCLIYGQLSTIRRHFGRHVLDRLHPINAG